jgi:hypothetical protein
LPDPPSFDPAHAVRFDLARGRVERDLAPGADATQRYLVVPVEAIEELALARAGGDAVEVVSRAVGASMGRRVALHLARAGGARAASVEAFAAELAGELAVSGCGVLRIERWGRALVLVLESAPLPDAVLAPMLEAAVAEAAEREVRCTVIARDAAAARVLVSSDAAGKRMRAWLAEGVAWGDALVRLHRGGAA